MSRSTIAEYKVIIHEDADGGQGGSKSEFKYHHPLPAALQGGRAATNKAETMRFLQFLVMSHDKESRALAPETAASAELPRRA